MIDDALEEAHDAVDVRGEHRWGTAGCEYAAERTEQGAVRTGVVLVARVHGAGLHTSARQLRFVCLF